MIVKSDLKVLTEISLRTFEKEYREMSNSTGIKIRASQLFQVKMGYDAIIYFDRYIKQE